MPPTRTFEAILPIFAEKRIGAFCWGLVAGRTQTIYPWDSWWKEYDNEPTRGSTTSCAPTPRLTAPGKRRPCAA